MASDDLRRPVIDELLYRVIALTKMLGYGVITIHFSGYSAEDKTQRHGQTQSYNYRGSYQRVGRLSM